MLRPGRPSRPRHVVIARRRPAGQAPDARPRVALAELIPGSFDLAGSIVVRAWLAAAGLLALAGLGRRHLPAGVGEVLVVVALSGALL